MSAVFVNILILGWWNAESQITRQQTCLDGLNVGVQAGATRRSWLKLGQEHLSTSLVQVLRSTACPVATGNLSSKEYLTGLETLLI